MGIDDRLFGKAVDDYKARMMFYMYIGDEKLREKVDRLANSM